MTKRKITKTREELVRRFPLCFMSKKQKKVPLKIGIYEDILARWPEISPKRIHRALQDYTTGWTYLSAMQFGADRIDLDGCVCGQVDEKSVIVSMKKIEALNNQYLKRARRRLQDQSKSFTKVRPGLVSPSRG
jgi:ProP effector